MASNGSFKIHDCSNSSKRPAHRGGGGPITNDVMRYLKENAEDYYIEFIHDPYDADVIITNDVFPDHILVSGKPLVKRMCSPFWHRTFIERNNPLNEAARSADKVIFITEYSRDQYIHLYGLDLKNYTVVTHWVDPKVFCVIHDMKETKFSLAACATNWNRKEKRLSEIIKFAEMFPDVEIILIGTLESTVPSNVVPMGYVDSPHELASILNMAHGFLNLSYRDAATKTIPQAISCGLPVLYANSGGVIEMVGEHGIGIKDNLSLDIMDSIPELNPADVKEAYSQFRDEFDKMKLVISAFDAKAKFRKMLDGYFSSIVGAVPVKEDEHSDI